MDSAAHLKRVKIPLPVPLFLYEVNKSDGVIYGK